MHIDTYHCMMYLFAKGNRNRMHVKSYLPAVVAYASAAGLVVVGGPQPVDSSY